MNAERQLFTHYWSSLSLVAQLHSTLS